MLGGLGTPVGPKALGIWGPYSDMGTPHTQKLEWCQAGVLHFHSAWLYGYLGKAFMVQCRTVHVSL